MSKQKVPISDKFLLTITEAAEYFNVGQNKIRWIIKEYANNDLVLSVGNKQLIKRKHFETLLENVSSI